MRLAGVTCQCGGEAVVACANDCERPSFDRSGEEEPRLERSEGATVRARAVRKAARERTAKPARRSPPRTSTARTYFEKVCPCGATFTPTGPRATYCSATCTARP